MIKRTLTSLLCALGIASFATQAEDSPKRFTTEFVAALSKALPNHSVVVTEPLRLKIQAADGKESFAFLDNAYNEYLSDPSEKTAIIDRFLGSVVETATKREELNPQRIVPVIKDRAWIEEMKLAGINNGLEGAPEQVVDDFNGDLVIVYAEDTPTNTNYFSPNNLKDTGVDRKELRKLAIANLRQILPPVETHSGELLSMLTAGGDYVASLLLIDEIWSDGKLAVDGEIVVAVPSREVILFTGSHNKAGVKKLQEVASKAVAENAYSLTDQLFVYRDGKFVRFAQ